MELTENKICLLSFGFIIGLSFIISYFFNLNVKPVLEPLSYPDHQFTKKRKLT